MIGQRMSKHRQDFNTAYEPRLGGGFRRVTPREPCPICKRTKWCQVTRDGRLAHCMGESIGAIKRAKDGGYVHVLIEEAIPNIQQPRPHSSALGNRHDVRQTLAPIEIRNAAYQKLLELSPAWAYERELVTAAPDGLLMRGLLAEDVSRFGALPPKVAERDELASEINRFIEENFTERVRETSHAGVIGVPGFWQASHGAVKIGRDYDYKRPALVIPYRDQENSVQACQLRFAGAKGDYHWLSTAEDRLDEEPHGTSSGCPLHWTFAESNPKSHAALPLLITEGALKAEVFVRLRPPMRAIATAGVGVAHAEIVRATNGRDVLIGFDSDHRDNAQVCRQLGKLIAEREQDARKRGLKIKSNVVV